MNIVFLSQFSGINPRGVETYVHELANCLVGLDHIITVFQSGPGLPNHKYDVKVINNNNFASQALSQITWHPDILVSTNGREQSFLSRLWCFKHHTKLIIPGQSGPGMDDRLNLYSFPDAFVGLTSSQCSWAKTNNPFVRVVNIPNGVDLKKFNPQVLPVKINLPRPIVLCVGALEPIKRQETLIQAAEKTNASVLLVGQGSQYEYLNQLGLRRLSGRFAIISASHDQMPSIYRACDLFVYPTCYWESFGIAMVEAMACGLPVLANDDPIRREIVGRAGDFINPTHTRLFTAALNECLSKKWVDIPFNRAKHYSWDAIASSYEQLFKGLLK